MAITDLQNKIRNSLQSAISQSLDNLNTGLDASTIEDVSSKVAASQSTSIVKSVYSTGSKQLDNIPKQIVGTKNPIDIVNSNLGSTGLYNNLNNAVNSQVTGDATAKLVSAVQGEITKVIPTGLPTISNIENITNNLSTQIQSTVSTAVNTTFKSFTDGIFSRAATITPLTKGVTGIFGSLVGSISKVSFDLGAVKKALDQIDKNFASTVTNKTLTEAKNFNVNNASNQDKLQVVKKGFTDPSATYPTKEYSGSSETNKLARGEVNGTVVQKKNSDRILGVRLPFNDSFSEPLSPFNGEYPYNKVTQTESGHLIEVDDTPGNERLHIYHKSGTYIEIDSNGTVVKRAKGSSYEFIDRNGKLAIMGQADISVNGACNIFIGNDCNMEVIGDVNLLCHNDITAQAGGKLNLSAKEEINIHSSNVNIEADMAMNILADGVLKVLSGNAINMTANTDVMITAANTAHVLATSNFFTSSNATHVGAKTELLLRSKEHMGIVSDKQINFTSTEQISIVSTADVRLQGSQVHMNSGGTNTANTASYAGMANIASISNVGLMEGRAYIDDEIIVDPEPIRYDARYTEQTEGYVPTDEELNAQKDRLILSGLATKDELEDDKPVVIAESTPTSSQPAVVLPDKALLNVVELPGNYNLSPNFTLDNMWRTVAVSPGKHPVRAQAGLTYGQIVYNLSTLALNVLEPVRALYPKMIITSCFRQEEGTSRSSHPVGLAVDMQFPGASKSEYYDIAVKLAQVLRYDQILLEYWVQANNPWIHVGLGPRGVFDSQSQRQVAWTFKDHKLFKQSLVNLA